MSTLITGLAELMTAVGADSPEELSDRADEHTDLDSWVMIEDDGIILRCGNYGTPLTYPFPVNAFWEALDGLEDAVVEELEATELATE